MIFTRLKCLLSTITKLIKISTQILYGHYKISKLDQPIISIFGGSRFKDDDFYFRSAHSLARRLVANNISILTGGGPGIMKASNCGAIYYSDKKIRSIGIGVKDLPESRNMCAQEYIELDYFFARKWLLTRYSIGFIVFPGGFGTLDELFEILTLMQTKKMSRAPIILVGVEYWKGFFNWINAESIRHGLIDVKEEELFVITDDMDQIFCLILDQCKI